MRSVLVILGNGSLLTKGLNMNVDLYLSKINVQRKVPSLSFLNELILAHQKEISFNNLAVYFLPGQILNLDLEQLFEKVILRGEGGYCFENNKLFYSLLEQLGFKVRPCLARVVYNKTGDIPRTHRTTLVHVEGEDYIADVGFGAYAAPEAVSMDTLKTSATHRITKIEDQYHLQLLKDGAYVDLYIFDLSRAQESDFKLANYYTSTHPDSKFVKDFIISRIEPGQIEFISGKVYTKIEKNKRTDVEIKNQDEFQFYLKKFGIEKVFDFGKL